MVSPVNANNTCNSLCDLDKIVRKEIDHPNNASHSQIDQGSKLSWLWPQFDRLVQPFLNHQDVTMMPHNLNYVIEAWEHIHDREIDQEAI